MKMKTTRRSLKNVLTVLVLLMVATTTTAQTRAREINPSKDNPNYDAQKLQVYERMRVRHSSDVNETDEIQLNRTESQNSEMLARATSTCFIPLDSSYTSIPRNDDGSFGPIALPFTFDLYGASYNQVWINTNGNLTFNGPYAVYSASGFPFSLPMVAPFWGDVDTRNLAGGQIYYKLSATNLIVTWDHVGYYNQQVDKLNEFQVVISDGIDPITGLGQNVCFKYGDMQWTTGSASSGINGFGGTPATVGVNKGNNIDYYQIGRFNQNSNVYDGPGGNPDGIDYLDQQCYCSQVSSAVNIAPIANNFPQDTITLACGDTFNLEFSFIPPEVNQTVTSIVNVNNTCGTSFSTTTGSLSNVSFSIVGQQCNEGVNAITFTATDDGTPVESTSVTLYVEVEPCCNLSAIAIGQDETCATASDGSIDITSSGGIGSVTYSIDGGLTYTSSSSFNGLPAGTYLVIAQDSIGCLSSPQTVIISAPSPLESASVASEILCSGGTATVVVTASGGTAPYSGIGTFVVSAGTYSFTVTDANGCTATTTGTISEPAELDLNVISTSIACYGGTADITVSASGGTAPYTGTGVFNVAAGSYDYLVLDSNGCSVDTTVVVAEPTQLTASISSTTIACFGGTSDITITASGGTAPYTGIGVYTVLAGTHTYTVTDANGCSVVVTTTVIEPSSITVSTTSSEVLCNGGTADVIVSASGGTAPYSGVGVYTVVAGTHIFTVTDATGCSSEATIVVSEPVEIEANISPLNPVIDCLPIPVTLSANPTGGTAPYSYLWSTGETTASIDVNPNMTTIYSVQITDANGCVSVASSNETTVTVLNRCGNNNQKVVICHVPHGNSGNPQTICISQNALNPHLSTLWNLHGGDYCGPCQESSALTTGSENEGDNTFIRAGINTKIQTIDISYRIGYDSPVRLEVYDMTGTLIDVIHTAQASEGTLYEFQVKSNKVASGVYIYQFITNSEKHIDKLQIIQQ